jgi:Fe(3+) dicitrate transport protein
MDAMVVTAESDSEMTKPNGWLPPVSGAQIFSGKKTAVIDIDAQARIVGNNYRQALSQTPGLILSEETTPLVSIGYRGLNPNRAQFTQILKDGIPIHADQIGYPEAYYTPALEAVDSIQFLHGGASLQYGPQPGGALNFITKRPHTGQPFTLYTQNVGGSDGLFGSFTSLEGTEGKLGYYVYYNHRQGDGFRSANSDYNLNNGSAKLIYAMDNGANVIFTAEAYTEDHGEPGGLTVEDFNSGSLKATRQYDHFSLDRNFISLGYEIAPTPDSFFTTTAWWTDYTRFSNRQRGTGNNFGTVPNGTTSSIEDQNFNTLGLDSRYRTNWGSEAQHAFATGIQLYNVDSPRLDSRGSTPYAVTGQVRSDSDREVFYLPVYAENKFTFGDFSITPGLRLENIYQSVKENVNLDKTNPLSPLADKNVNSHILLGGLGLEYAIDKKSAVYGNVSQSYRPQLFTQAVPLGNGQVVNDDLEEGSAIEYEVGYRTQTMEWLTVDASLFLLSFTDQIGSVTTAGITNFQNVGDATYKGIDFAVATDLLNVLTDSDTYGSLNCYVNGTILDAEFTDGPNDGKTPQYAPDYLIRTGLNYNYNDKLEISFGGTFQDDSYGDDNNTQNFAIPSFMVWDLTAEWEIHKHVHLLAGINNLFDESYYSRVVPNGIDPAYGRNFYAGASFKF